MKDYYKILDITREADQEDIKRAYRKMARIYHPDVHEGEENAEERFKEISEAYEVLSDPERRRRYDLFGEEGLSAPIFERGFEGFGGPLDDIFSMFFGRGHARSSRSPRRGSDLITTIEIELQEAYSGLTRKVEIPRHEACSECGGTGLDKGYEHDLCPDCGGDGRTTNTRRSAFGTFTSTTSCRRCGGTGGINTHPCPGCEGRGAERIVDAIEVNIPPGIDSGDRIRVTGKGEAGSMGGHPGDLYIEIRIREHETFTRQGNDLHAIVSVSMVEAALGTDIDIPTMNGQENLRIPPGSQPGEIFKLRGKGMPSVRSRRVGDLFLTLDVQIPRKLTSEQKKLLLDYQQIEQEKKEAAGIIARLRKAMRT